MAMPAGSGVEDVRPARGLARGPQRVISYTDALSGRIPKIRTGRGRFVCMCTSRQHPPPVAAADHPTQSQAPEGLEKGRVPGPATSDIGKEGIPWERVVAQMCMPGVEEPLQAQRCPLTAHTLPSTRVGSGPCPAALPKRPPPQDLLPNAAQPHLCSVTFLERSKTKGRGVGWCPPRRSKGSSEGTLQMGAHQGWMGISEGGGPHPHPFRN